MQTNGTQSEPRHKSLRRGTKWLLWVAVFLALLLGLSALVFYSPRLLSTDFARARLLSFINSKADADLSVETWRFDWQDGIFLEGIRFDAPEKLFFLEAGGLVLDMPLLDMAKIALTVRSKGLEELPSVPIRGNIILYGGLISADSAPDHSLIATNSSVTATFEGSIAQSSFSFSADSAQGGSISATGAIQLDRGKPVALSSIKGDLSLKIKEWNLSPIIERVFAARDLEPPALSGTLGGAIAFNIEGAETASAEGELALWPSFRDEAAASLQHHFSTLDLSFAIKKGGPAIAIESLSLSADFFRAAVLGSLGLTDSNTLASAQISFDLKAEPREAMEVASSFIPVELPQDLFMDGSSSLDLNGELSIPESSGGNIDALSLNATGAVGGLNIGGLAALAPEPALFPTIEGAAAISVEASIRGTDSQSLQASVEARNLKASGYLLSGDEPHLDRVTIGISLNKAGRRIDLESFELRSSLLEADANGSIETSHEGNALDSALSITATIFAAEAASIFPKTLKLRPDTSFSGGTLGLIASASSRGGRLEFDGELGASGLTAFSKGRHIGLEKDISAKMKGFASKDDLSIERLDIDSSFLEARASGSKAGALATLVIDLSEAFQQASQFFDLEGRSASGKITIDASTSLPGSRALELAASANAADLAFTGFSPSPLKIEEARLNLEALADISDAGTIESIHSLMLDLNSDIGALMISAKDILSGPPISARLLEIEAKARLEQLVALAGAFGSEPDEIELEGEGTFSARCLLKQGILNCEQLTLISETFAFRKGAGLEIKDSARFSGHLAIPLLGSMSDKLKEADADLSFQTASIKMLGVAVSDLNAPLRVKGGQAELDLRATVNEGSLTLPLRVDASRQPPVLKIPDATQIMKDIRVTDEMINGMFSYVAPLLKDCVVSSGSIGAVINECELTLGSSDPDKAKFSSTASFREISLISAGVLLEALSTAQLGEKRIDIPDQDIETVLRNGRFHSSDLRLLIGGQSVIISGSVGLDQTLDYKISLPIASSLVGKQAYERLKNESIVLQIAGTVGKPTFDRAAFLKEIASMASRAVAREFLERGSEQGGALLEKGAEELLRFLDR